MNASTVRLEWLIVGILYSLFKLLTPSRSKLLTFLLKYLIKGECSIRVLDDSTLPIIKLQWPY